VVNRTIGSRLPQPADHESNRPGQSLLAGIGVEIELKFVGDRRLVARRKEKTIDRYPELRGLLGKEMGLHCQWIGIAGREKHGGEIRRQISRDVELREPWIVHEIFGAEICPEHAGFRESGERSVIGTAMQDDASHLRSLDRRLDTNGPGGRGALIALASCPAICAPAESPARKYFEGSTCRAAACCWR